MQGEQQRTKHWPLWDTTVYSCPGRQEAIDMHMLVSANKKTSEPFKQLCLRASVASMIFKALFKTSLKISQFIQ